MTIIALIRIRITDRTIMTAQPLPSASKYWVHQKGETLGPFEQQFIEAMFMAQVYSPSVLVCKVKTKEWVSFSNIINVTPLSSAHGQSVANPSPSRPAKTQKIKPPKNTFNIILPWALGVFVILFVLKLYTLAQSSKPAAKPQTYKEKIQAAESTTSSVHRPSSLPSGSLRKVNESVIIPRSQEKGQVLRDASGRTYRVPDAAYYRLVSLQSALDIKKLRLETEKRDYESMASSLERERRYLDTTSEYSVEAFNRRVNKLNETNEDLQNLVNDYNRDVKAFNYELERVGTLIN